METWDFSLFKFVASFRQLKCYGKTNRKVGIPNSG